MFKYVQWAIFLLTFLFFAVGGLLYQRDNLGTQLIVGFLIATVGTFVASLFLRPIWDMFAGMFGKD